MPGQLQAELVEPLQLGPVTINSRLIVGTGKYASYELMQTALDASGAEVVTVAVRRERLLDDQGRSLLDFIDTDRYTILPNTAGCFTAKDAVRVARLGREILEQLVASLGLTRKRIAVAVNLDVIPHSSFAVHGLATGDRIEILEAVGGG